MVPCMRFPSPLIEATLIRRYKRFLADVTLADGTVVTAHCANPGSMMGLKEPGSQVFLAPAVNPKSKLRYSLELIRADLPGGPQLVAINTSNPNRLAEKAILGGQIPELAGYSTFKREVKYSENSRVDILLSDENKPACFVEVKNCHLMRKAGLAEFPDSVTTRGAKHLKDLSNEIAAGNRAVMLYIIQMQASAFALASDLDPVYVKAFAEARAAGVEAIAYTCHVGMQGIAVDKRVNIVF